MLGYHLLASRVAAEKPIAQDAPGRDCHLLVLALSKL